MITDDAVDYLRELFSGDDSSTIAGLLSRLDAAEVVVKEAEKFGYGDGDIDLLREAVVSWRKSRGLT